MKLSKKQIQHIYWRGGFGIHPCLLDQFSDWQHEKIIDRLFSASTNYAPFVIDLSSLDVIISELSSEGLVQYRKDIKKYKRDLNSMWMKEMSSTRAALREKMAFFWHDHFAVNEKSPKMNIDYVNLLRKNALNNFGDLLEAVSKSPAMLTYLNAKQNRKSSPNENFSRELMELFTLGRDQGYSETDIQEAARAFTGWTFDDVGKFKINSKIHDNDEKTFLGKTGDFDGDDILKILLEQKQTAKYITGKIIDFIICRPLPDEVMNKFSTLFYESKYDIKTLLRAIFISQEFIDEKSIGVRIKSPTELIVGLNRQFKIEYQNPNSVFYFQRELNQVLCYPPNVAGWVSGTGWIDNLSLMLRMNLASILLNDGVLEWDDTSLTDEEENLNLRKNIIKQKKTAKKFGAIPDWDFVNSDIHIVKDELSDYFIQPILSSVAKEAIANQVESSLKDKIILLCSLPEYQLC